MADRFKNILKKIKKVINGVDLDPTAHDAADRIRRRTRLSGGVKDSKRGGNRTKLDGLSPRYKKQRAKDKKNGILDKTTTAKRSNLTRTGQMLRSLTGRVRGKTIIVSLEGDRDDGKSNAEVANYHRTGEGRVARDFFELTDKEIKGLRNQVKKDLIKSLRKNKI